MRLADEFFRQAAHLPAPRFEDSEAFMMGGHGWGHPPRLDSAFSKNRILHVFQRLEPWVSHNYRAWPGVICYHT